jgi:hypothetical protein
MTSGAAIAAAVEVADESSSGAACASADQAKTTLEAKRALRIIFFIGLLESTKKV